MAQISPRSHTSLLADIPRRSLVRLASLIVVSMSTVVACGSDTVAPITQPVSSGVSIAVTKSSVTLIRGQSNTTQIAATVNGSSNTGLTYTSVVPGIATVSSTGLVTAVSDGSTSILITSQADPTVNTSVVVNVVSTIVTTSANSAFSWVGGPTRTITAAVQNNANAGVTFTSTNTSVATVSSTGVVTPVGAGTTSITAISVGDPTKQSAVTFTVDPAPGNETVLTSGVSVAGLGGADGAQTFYRIVVPVGATSLTVALSGGSGDVDLFVRAGVRPPSAQSYTATAGFSCFAAGPDTNETCTIANPGARIFYVLVDSFGFSGTSLVATIK